MRNISIGIMVGVLICMIILTYFPIVETELTCGKCGSKAWYFQIVGGNE